MVSILNKLFFMNVDCSISDILNASDTSLKCGSITDHLLLLADSSNLCTFTAAGHATGHTLVESTLFPHHFNDRTLNQRAQWDLTPVFSAFSLHFI